MQRYCPACSEVRDTARKQTYQINSGREKFDAKRAGWKDTGRLISYASKTDLTAWVPTTAALVWYRKVEMPFGWAASKNHIFTTTRTGHTFLRDEARYYRSELTTRIREAVGDQQVFQNKLWLDIFVQKINHRGDAVNFLDLISDSVKDAIPLDDRWYSIRTLDWEICKHDPMILVGLGQDKAYDAQPCTACGRVLTLDHFQKNRAASNGVGRVCRQCQAAKPKVKKLEGVFA